MIEMRPNGEPIHVFINGRSMGRATDVVLERNAFPPSTKVSIDMEEDALPLPAVVATPSGHIEIAIDPDTGGVEMISVPARTKDVMRWEYGVEQATGATQWLRSRPMAEAHAEARGAFRIVRRLVGPAEPIAKEAPND